MEQKISTIEDVIKYVQPCIENFRRFPSKKDENIEKLRLVFDVNSDYLDIVVKDGRFAETFYKKMGKGRMRALKKLLYAMNNNYYAQIDFKEE